MHLYSLSIPVEDLASNGESVRGKVFHIACALCTQAMGNDADQELIRDWCNMVCHSHYRPRQSPLHLEREHNPIPCPTKPVEKEIGAI
jgi:hypothetical protein